MNNNVYKGGWLMGIYTQIRQLLVLEEDLRYKNKCSVGYCGNGWFKAWGKYTIIK